MERGVESSLAKPAPRRLPIVPLLVAIAAVVLLVYWGRAAGTWLHGFALWVEGLGVWGPVAFILGYIVATVAFVPGLILTLAAGALFGLARGVAYVFIGATLGSAAAFLLARYVARGAIERRLGESGKFAAIDRAVAVQGFRIVLLLRLSPVFPYNLLNYALGLTRVRFVDYLLASIGMIPGPFLYVYYGGVIGEVAALAGGVEVERGAGYYAVLGLGLAATIVVTLFVTRLARRALAEQTGSTS
jgi:uncharacterized membrane protein YdjX (TVP38/TMEM64 family)